MRSASNIFLARSGIGLPEALTTSIASLFSSRSIQFRFGCGVLAIGVTQYAVTHLNNRHSHNPHIKKITQIAESAVFILNIAFSCLSLAQLAHTLTEYRGIALFTKLPSLSLGHRVVFGLSAYMSIAALGYAGYKTAVAVNNWMNPTPNFINRSNATEDDDLVIPDNVSIKNNHPGTEETSQALLVIKATFHVLTAIASGTQSICLTSLSYAALTALNFVSLARRKWSSITSQDITLPLESHLRISDYVAKIDRIRFRVFFQQTAGNAPLEEGTDCGVCLDPIKGLQDATEFCPNRPNGHLLHNTCATKIIANSFYQSEWACMGNGQGDVIRINGEAIPFEQVKHSFVGKGIRGINLKNDYRLKAKEIRDNSGKRQEWDLYLLKENLSSCPSCRNTEPHHRRIEAEIHDYVLNRWISIPWGRVHVLSNRDDLTG